MPHTQNRKTQEAATPDTVIDWLTEGNKRFVSGVAVRRDTLADMAATAGGQYPLAAVLACIDSRVPVEIVFDIGIGDAFVARSAGNVVDDDVRGGLEFATELAGAKVIVVLGHTACGAVKGACDGAELGNLTQLLAKITPAVEAVGAATPCGDDPAVVTRVVTENVDNSIAALRSSEVLAAREQSGSLRIVGAVYDIESGVVTWRNLD